MTDSYYSIAEVCNSELKISRSKFISRAYPVADSEDALSKVRSFRKEFHDASHFPFAYRTGIDKNNFRYSDDGEPTGTAGKPILEAIDRHQISDVLLVCARYFGGIKLGTGGLRRAFGESAELCLSNCRKKEIVIMSSLKIECGYDKMNVVMNILGKANAEILKNESDEVCKLNVIVRKSVSELLANELTQATAGKINISIL